MSLVDQLQQLIKNVNDKGVQMERLAKEYSTLKVEVQLLTVKKNSMFVDSLQTIAADSANKADAVINLNLETVNTVARTSDILNQNISGSNPGDIPLDDLVARNMQLEDECSAWRVSMPPLVIGDPDEDEFIPLDNPTPYDYLARMLRSPLTPEKVRELIDKYNKMSTLYSNRINAAKQGMHSLTQTKEHLENTMKEAVVKLYQSNAIRSLGKLETSVVGATASIQDSTTEITKRTAVAAGVRAKSLERVSKLQNELDVFLQAISSMDAISNLTATMEFLMKREAEMFALLQKGLEGKASPKATIRYMAAVKRLDKRVENYLLKDTSLYRASKKRSSSDRVASKRVKQTQQ